MDISIEPFNILRGELSGMIAFLVALAPNLLAGLFAVVLTWVLAMAITRFVSSVVLRSRTRPSLRRALLSLTRIAIWTIGILVTATIVFPNLTPTKLLAGLGVGSIAIGLAFKDIFENFLAGVLILIREPMRIGDDIECESISGTVEEITIRDTYIRKRSGELILVPNSYIFKNPTKVLTDRPLRRIALVVGIAYGEDVDRGREVIRNALQGLETVDPDRGVEVLAREFNSSSIDFLVRWWTGSTPRQEHHSRDRAVAAIKAALDAEGIEIPFPYRTLTFKAPLPVRTLDRDSAPASPDGGGAS